MPTFTLSGQPTTNPDEFLFVCQRCGMRHTAPYQQEIHVCAATAQNVLKLTATKLREEQTQNGPGTMLTKMLEKIGITSSPNCACKARAQMMNQHGADWCEKNLDIIVGWLREEAEKRKLPFIDMAGTLLVKRAISLSRAAKKKQAKNGSSTPNSSDT